MERTCWCRENGVSIVEGERHSKHLLKYILDSGLNIFTACVLPQVTDATVIDSTLEDEYTLSAIIIFYIATLQLPSTSLIFYTGKKWET